MGHLLPVLPVIVHLRTTRSSLTGRVLPIGGVTVAGPQIVLPSDIITSITVGTQVAGPVIDSAAGSRPAASAVLAAGCRPAAAPP